RNNPALPIVLYDPWGASLPCGAGCKPWHTSGTHDIVAFDINGDGLKDMIYANCVGYACWIQQLPPMTLSLTEPAPGGLNLTVSFAPPSTAVYNLPSLIQLPIPGSGPFFGLDASALTLFSQFFPAEPFLGFTNASGSYSFSFPAGTFVQTIPWTWQVRSAAFNGPELILSNVVTKTF
ncbi:MAG TPA: hypothetical protein VEI02_07850, partial [Planctomycetota bacterium]|nr:hypothetical protein [Planctomycetota bacterium]